MVEDERQKKIQDEAEKKRKREEKETRRLLKADTEARPSKYLVDFDEYQLAYRQAMNSRSHQTNF